MSRPLPKYKSDPTRILCHRACGHCGESFPVATKFPAARFCSRKCGLAATLPPDHNSRVARASASRRGDVQRGRGAGRTYRKRGGRHEHRVVAQQVLGRPLLPGEVVHHIDGDKQNNAPANLEVLPSQAAHATRHGIPRGVRGVKPGLPLTHNGRTQNLSAWARQCGVALSTISWRLRAGWTVSQALDTQASSGNRVVQR